MTRKSRGRRATTTKALTIWTTVSVPGWTPQLCPIFVLGGPERHSIAPWAAIQHVAPRPDAAPWRTYNRARPQRCFSFCFRSVFRFVLPVLLRRPAQTKSKTRPEILQSSVQVGPCLHFAPPPQISDVANRNRDVDFFAFSAAPQETTQGEKPVLGKGSGLRHRMSGSIVIKAEQEE